MLCILLASFAVQVGLAVRQRERKVGAAANVLDAVGALLHTSSSKHAAGYAKIVDELRLASEARETPGATESLNEILNQVMADLEANVETKITAGVQDTQQAIDQSVGDLTAATEAALEKKALADEHDLSWITCVGEEKAKLQDVEAAEVALEQAEQSVVAPCQEQADKDLFSFKPDSDFEFSCSFGAGACAAGVADYKVQVNNMLSTFDTNAEQATASWEDAKGRCDAAHADVAAKTTALGEAQSAWTNQRSTCLEKHEARQLDICLFGEDLQHKCSKKDAYLGLMAEVDQVDAGVHSQPDRLAEWQTVQTVKCMLSKVVAGTELTTTAMDECESNQAGAPELPALDRREGDFAEWTSVANFNCEEQTITFNGETWEIPESDPKSEQYQKVPFNPEVNLVNPPAFSFCAGGPGKP